jgi:hypothetical protein
MRHSSRQGHHRARQARTCHCAKHIYKMDRFLQGLPHRSLCLYIQSCNADSPWDNPICLLACMGKRDIFATTKSAPAHLHKVGDWLFSEAPLLMTQLLLQNLPSRVQLIKSPLSTTRPCPPPPPNIAQQLRKQSPNLPTKFNQSSKQSLLLMPQLPPLTSPNMLTCQATAEKACQLKEKQAAELVGVHRMEEQHLGHITKKNERDCLRKVEEDTRK